MLVTGKEGWTVLLRVRVSINWAQAASQRDAPHGEEKTCFSAALRDAVSLVQHEGIQMSVKSVQGMQESRCEKG
jgi:hypothetical protein